VGRRELPALAFRRGAISTAPATILVSQEGTTARITLNRPEKRNALSLELMGELKASLETLGPNPDIRAIVIEASRTTPARRCRLPPNSDTGRFARPAVSDRSASCVRACSRMFAAHWFAVSFD